MCFVLPGEGGVRGGEERRKWVKTGIEFTHGKPHVSTVACDRWADWSLLPMEGEKVTVSIYLHRFVSSLRVSYAAFGYRFEMFPPCRNCLLKLGP